MAEQDGNQATEAFTKMWSDMFSQMNAGGFGAANPMDVSKQMQRAFLDSMARYCDEFMRSEQYLEMMKHTMDGALTFRRQMDDFMRQAHEQTQSPTRDDVSQVVEAVQGLERRLTERLAELESRLTTIEKKSEPPNK